MLIICKGGNKKNAINLLKRSDSVTFLIDPAEWRCQRQAFGVCYGNRHHWDSTKQLIIPARSVESKSWELW